MTTFAPPVVPSSTSTTKTINQRVRTAGFGDGYTQRGRDGLNFTQRIVTLIWDALSSDDADTIEAFMVATGGADVFSYTLPLESTAYQWTCGPVKRTYVGASIVGLSVDLTQQFDL